MTSINEITYDMIEEMQHCIGFSKNKVTGIKHRVMYAYRNRFCDHKDNKKWNALVDLQLAYIDDYDYVTGIHYYSLTLKGFDFLAKLCGFEKIVDID